MRKYELRAVLFCFSSAACSVESKAQADYQACKELADDRAEVDDLYYDAEVRTCKAAKTLSEAACSKLYEEELARVRRERDANVQACQEQLDCTLRWGERCPLE